MIISVSFCSCLFMVQKGLEISRLHTFDLTSTVFNLISCRENKYTFLSSGKEASLIPNVCQSKGKNTELSSCGSSMKTVSDLLKEDEKRRNPNCSTDKVVRNFGDPLFSYCLIVFIEALCGVDA